MKHLIKKASQENNWYEHFMNVYKEKGEEEAFNELTDTTEIVIRNNVDEYLEWFKEDINDESDDVEKTINNIRKQFKGNKYIMADGDFDVFCASKPRIFKTFEDLLKYLCNELDYILPDFDEDEDDD